MDHYTGSIKHVQYENGSRTLGDTVDSRVITRFETAIIENRLALFSYSDDPVDHLVERIVPTRPFTRILMAAPTADQIAEQDAKRAADAANTTA
jgi:hypothetical protein